jgi:hypothetical protein
MRKLASSSYLPFLDSIGVLTSPAIVVSHGHDKRYKRLVTFRGPVDWVHIPSI